MRNLLIAFISSILFLSTFASFAKSKAPPVEVKVGGYIFEPFVMEMSDGSWNGVTLDLIETLNRLQDDYYFKFVHTSSLRRFEDLSGGHFDIMFFENKKWGWDDYPVNNSKVFLSGGEVYVALRSNKSLRQQNYFDSFHGKKIVGVTGFHYGFTHFRPLDDTRKADFEMIYVQSGEACLGMVLKNRADIAVVSRALVNRFVFQNPQYKDHFLISSRMDQVYQHSALVKVGSPIDINRINAIIERAKQTGQLEKVWLKNHLLNRF